MLIAAIGNTPYNIVLLVHVLLVVVAMAPVFVHPLLRRQSREGDGTERQHLFISMAHNARIIYGPALILTGLLGFAIAGMSDKVYAVRQGWLIAAVIVWIAMIGVQHGMVRPALKAVGAGNASSGTERRLDLGAELLTVMFVVQLVLMIWKPGL